MLSETIKAQGDPQRARAARRYFKTNPGEYGEGDVFIGLTVPQVRAIAKTFRQLPLDELKKSLQSPIHEERLAVLLILVERMKKASHEQKEDLVHLYLSNTKFINNWDLVDTSAASILGSYLWQRPKTLLKKLARSKSLWEKRIAMISTFYFIKQGDATETLKMVQLLSKDPHDLIHKAMGWMLREVGKNCGEQILVHFLKSHYRKLPRTTLRYAIEKFPKKDREAWLKGRPN